MSVIDNQDALRIPIPLEHNPYEVVIGGKGLAGAGEELLRSGFKTGTKILVVTNSDIAKLYGDLFLNSLKESGYETTLFEIEAGETQKTPETISLIHDAAYSAKLERSSLMIALGGGVVGDMAGFAAATWLRGISIVQVPTTLLAMVDASIGGKTGVNHPGGKNLIGAFHQPKLVLIDPSTLKSLPKREFRAGLAEVIKYGVIGDPILFEILEGLENPGELEGIPNQDLKTILERATTSKAKIVVLDEHEGGIRAILNYGHTFGHVVETLAGYGTFLHGEAVAIGMIAIGELALKKKYWTSSDCNRQKALIEKVGLPTIWPNLDPKDVYSILEGDKKVKDGNIRFVIPKKIGEVAIKDDIKKEEILNILSIIS